MSGAPETTKIEYEDGGPDTSVKARPGLTGMGNASPLNDLPTGSTSDLPPGLTPGGDRRLQGQLHNIYAEKQDADESAIDNRLLKQDRDRIQRQYDATAVEPGEFPKWNSDEQATKYRTDPLSAFGSLGSVAGMIASAFTHHPMQNAMEASAAAMNAIHAGDQKAYDQAHEAWKQNLDLAIKRHEIEQQRFGDAMKLMDTDIHLGEVALRNNAVRFGDKQALAMLDAGMLPELVQTRAQMADTYLKLQAVRDDMEQHGISGAMADRMEKQVNEKWPPGSPEHEGAMYEVLRIRNQLNSKDFSTQEYGQWSAKFLSKEGRFPTTEEKNDYVRKQAEAKRGGMSSLSAAEAQSVQIRAAQIERETGGAPGSGLPQAVSEFQARQHQGTAANGGKVDQSIVNQLEHYPGMKQSDLGVIPAPRQIKLNAAFESAKNLEAIAKFVKENPDAIGLAAKVSNNMNLDAYQGLVAKANAGDKDSKDALQSLQGQAEADFDKKADKQLTLTQAGKAKVLNKMLTTQAFADAAASGSRGGTIFLDKVFKELYDQSSSPGAFYSILEKRYDEANNVAEEYHLGFDRRNDKESMPFWNGKAAGYAGKSTGAAHVVTDSKGDKYLFIGTDYESQKRDKSKFKKVE